MPGCWVREDNAWEWKTPNEAAPEVDMAENPVTGVLLGADGEPVTFMLEREPIGYRQRWKHG